MGHLVIIGGAVELEGKIIQTFFDLAGRRNARIVVMTVASGEPKESGDDYKDIFKRLDVDDVRVIDTAEQEDANDPDALNAIKEASGVFFTGGAQERICRKLKDTQLEQLLHQRYQEPDFVIGGTSAGAHAMSDQMITEGPSQTNPRYQSEKILPGLGFLQRVIIDCTFAHF